MDAKACREYAKEMRSRYLRADRAQRSRLLDEFTAVTGYHRKYAVRCLPGRRPRVYDPRVSPLVSPPVDQCARGYLARCRLPVVCATRCNVAVVDASRASSPRPRSGTRATVVRDERSFDRPSASAAPYRSQTPIYGRTKPGSMLKHHIPMRTERWDTTEVGWCETDTVAHCGGSGDRGFCLFGQRHRRRLDMDRNACRTGERPALCGPSAAGSARERTLRAAWHRFRQRVGVRQPALLQLVQKERTALYSRSAPITKTTTRTSSKRTGPTFERSLAGSVSIRRQLSTQ